MFEKLIKNNLGQWKLLKDSMAPLKKAIWEKAPHIRNSNCICGGAMRGDGMHHYSCVDANASGKPFTPTKAQFDNHVKLSDMFHNAHKARVANNHGDAEAYTNQIRNLINSAPEGDIDLGGLHKLKTQHDGSKDYRHDGRFTDRDYLRAANKHIGDGVKSLKDVHDRHGIDAVKGLARAHGVYNDDYGGTESLDERPFGQHNRLRPLSGDVEAFFDGNYGNHKPLDEVDTSTPGARAYVQLDPDGHSMNDEETKEWDTARNKTWDAFDDWIAHSDDEDKKNAYEEAAVDHGVHDFKRHHKIK